MTSIALNNKVKIPQLGFGTWKLKPPIEARTAVDYALKVGYRHIDTARIYLNEGSVGKAIASSGIDREDIFVTTKLWNMNHKHALQAFEHSLRRLGLDYVDLYLIHYPVTGTRLAAWQAMEEAAAQEAATLPYPEHVAKALASLKKAIERWARDEGTSDHGKH